MKSYSYIYNLDRLHLLCRWYPFMLLNNLRYVSLSRMMMSTTHDTHIQKEHLNSDNASHSDTCLLTTQTNQVVKDRQEGIILSGLSKHICNHPDFICKCFKHIGIEIQRDHLLVMRNMCGIPMGNVAVLTNQPLSSHIKSPFPIGTTVTLLDTYDLQLFVEKCERFQTFTEDLHWLAQPQHFNRIVTIVNIPTSYGRRELRDVLLRYCSIKVEATDIVFQFNSKGDQTGIAWVMCPTEHSVNRIIHYIQELPVPEKVQYASLFGCSFLWSYRLHLFMSHPQLDFELHRSKNQVFLTGWDKLTQSEDIQALMRHHSLFPLNICRIYNPVTANVSFLLEFFTMKCARSAMMKFSRLKHCWALPKNTLLYAFPRQADVKWVDEKGNYADLEEQDSDIEDPIDY